VCRGGRGKGSLVPVGRRSQHPLTALPDSNEREGRACVCVQDVVWGTLELHLAHTHTHTHPLSLSGGGAVLTSTTCMMHTTHQGCDERMGGGVCVAGGGGPCQAIETQNTEAMRDGGDMFIRTKTVEVRWLATSHTPHPYIGVVRGEGE